MALITLYRKYQFVDYQNRLCSLATFITLATILSAIILPIVYIYKINNNKFSTNENLITFEQPYTKFQYKYLFLIENSLDNQLISCSSFNYINKLTDDVDTCSKIKVLEKDMNYDGVNDEISISLDFHTPYKFGLKFISIVLLFEARLGDQCDFNIPSALVINKKFFPDNTNDRDITINGNLNLHQIMSLQCPFFMRNIKSHFFLNILNENTTDLEDYKIKNIERALKNNPAYFYFEEKETHFGELSDEKSSIKINMKIQEVQVRYKKSFWQNLGDIWIVFLSIFLITLFLANFLLTCLFENRWVWARKRNYFANKFD